ncbi:MAG: family transcriptional regulator, cyclic receptor protein, partial [Mucilaginibacter sp.]|nr:family transcriptional regulator, cyclic receptor protein [Mucilaginibacter sp.]
MLLEDPELAACLPVAVRGRAIEECLADVVRLSPGRWDPPRTPVLSSGIGLLVLDGLLIRRVGVDGRFGAELLGDGDLLRPWQGPDSSPPLPRTTGWRLLAPTRLALLDERAAESLARYPSLTGCMVAKAVERARNLAVNLAIVHQPRTDVRLQMLFWDLADSWGRVRA